MCRKTFCTESLRLVCTAWIMGDGDATYMVIITHWPASRGYKCGQKMWPVLWRKKANVCYAIPFKFVAAIKQFFMKNSKLSDRTCTHDGWPLTIPSHCLLFFPRSFLSNRIEKEPWSLNKTDQSICPNPVRELIKWIAWKHQRNAESWTHNKITFRALFEQKSTPILSPKSCSHIYFEVFVSDSQYYQHF